MTQRTPQAKDRSCKVGDSVTALSNFHISPELTIPKGTRGKVTATNGHAVLVDWGMPEIGLRWCSIFDVQKDPGQ